jgi:spermidine/putrescine transport system permease protein
MATQPKALTIWTSLRENLFTGYAVLFYIFLYAPIIVLVIFSFNDASRAVAKWTGFTLHWYEELLDDFALERAVRNSLRVAVTATVISTILGTMISVAMERFRFRAKSVVDGVLFLPIIIPDIAMGVMLLSFFALINTHFDLLELSLTTIIIAHVAFNISFVAVIVRARMASIDPTLWEAASDLYANEWQTFWRITFPLLIPGILGGALFAFTLSLDDYVIAFFTSGPGSTTLPIRVYGLARRGISPEVNALSSVMLLASFTLALIFFVASYYMDRRERRSYVSNE